jgi:hypothetical protein
MVQVALRLHLGRLDRHRDDRHRHRNRLRRHRLRRELGWRGRHRAALVDEPGDRHRPDHAYAYGSDHDDAGDDDDTEPTGDDNPIHDGDSDA